MWRATGIDPAGSAAQRQGAHACGRAVMAVDPDLRMEDLPDRPLARLSQQTWVAVNSLAEETAPRTQLLRDGVTEPCTSIWRRRSGVKSAAGFALGTHNTAEPVPGRASALYSAADILPVVRAGRR